MRAKARTAEFSLSGEGIDLMSEWLDEAQRDLGVGRERRVRVRVLVEELLLRMRDRLGEGAPVRAGCDVALGRARLRVEVAGTPCNPLASVDPRLGAWDSALRGAIGLTPRYAYEGGRNVLRLTLSRQGTNPLARLAVAILCGTLLGIVGAAAIPAPTREVVAGALLAPAYDAWVRLLTAISGPIVFCTVATTMINARSIDERGGSSLVVVVRYFGLSLAAVTVALLCAAPLYPLGHSGIRLSAELVSGLLDGLLAAIPANAVEPFVASDTAQLLLLAFSLGYVLVRLEGRVDGLRRLMREADEVCLQVAEWVGLLVPALTGAFLCLEIWEGQVSVLAGLWRPLGVALAISLATLALLGILLARRVRLRPGLLARKLWGPFFVALRTGSVGESLDEARRSCALLGIDADYAQVALPQGLVLYMPVSAIGTIAFTLFAAREFEVQGDAIWYVSAVVMAVVVFVATPPVPGANLLAYVVLFSALGVPEEALLDAMVFDIVFGVFAGAANQAMLQMEMLRQAARLGLLDAAALRRDAPPTSA